MMSKESEGNIKQTGTNSFDKEAIFNLTSPMGKPTATRPWGMINLIGRPFAGPNIDYFTQIVLVINLPHNNNPKG